MLHRTLTGALLGASALALAALPTAASAQRVDRIVAFGDSYADDGNVFQLTGTPLPAPYSTGRFSGGTNYIDTLSALLGVPVDNFAIGGALTDNRNTSGAPLGFQTEWQSFLAGGGPAAFPRVSGTFDENDLLTLSIGGNDGRVYQQTGGTVAGAAAAAATSVAAAETGLDALVGAGARTISYIAGDTSRMPEVAGNTAAQAVRSAFAQSFNSGFQDILAGYADNGVVVHYLDLNLMGDRIIADPAAYGLTSAGGCPVAQATRCVTDPAFANQYLFYVDQVHLTSAGFAIVGRYIDAQLTAPLTLGAASNVGFDVARQFGRTLTSRVDLGSPRDGETAEGTRFFVVGDTFSRDVGISTTTNAYDIDGVGATAGVEFGFGNGVVGIAGNITRPKVKFATEEGRVRGRSLQIGAYAGTAIGPVFVQGHLGYGRDKHKVRRTGVIDNLSARPDGSHWTAGAKAGYLAPLGVFRAGPVVALDYVKAKVDGYTEEGDEALALDVRKQDLKALTGAVGIEVRGDFAGGGIPLRPYFTAVAEKDFTGDGRTAVWSQTSAPGIVNRFDIGNRSKDPYVRLSGGASAALATNISLDANVSSTFGQDDGDELGAQVGLRVGF
ncbi:autotransporter domain-containing protein [Sphingomonas arenae]|uniref:autotransporter domain-containing protein n=1 Tax=Sphingomonas arenae TaxID=2812555 RepID=UPI0019672892